MLGAGGVVVVALSAYFGRLPVLFWFLLFAFATAIWCAAATTFESFMAARILNGFFSTVAQGGGLMFIQDMFYFHERAYVLRNLIRSPREMKLTCDFQTEDQHLGSVHHSFALLRTTLRSIHYLNTEMANSLLGIHRRNRPLPCPNNPLHGRDILQSSPQP